MKRIWIMILLSALLLCACGEDMVPWQEAYDQGLRHMDNGHYLDAVSSFSAAVEIDPYRPEGLVGRADAYAALNRSIDDLTHALNDYRSAMELDDSCEEAYIGTANVHLLRGNTASAISVLEEGYDNTDSEKIAAMLAELTE